MFLQLKNKKRHTNKPSKVSCQNCPFMFITQKFTLVFNSAVKKTNSKLNSLNSLCSPRSLLITTFFTPLSQLYDLTSLSNCLFFVYAKLFSFDRILKSLERFARTPSSPFVNKSVIDSFIFYGWSELTENEQRLPSVCSVAVVCCSE